MCLYNRTLAWVFTFVSENSPATKKHALLHNQQTKAYIRTQPTLAGSQSWSLLFSLHSDYRKVSTSARKKTTCSTIQWIKHPRTHISSLTMAINSYHCLVLWRHDISIIMPRKQNLYNAHNWGAQLKFTPWTHISKSFPTVSHVLTHFSFL